MKYNQTNIFYKVTAFDPIHNLVTCRRKNENLLIAPNNQFVLDELPIIVREIDQIYYLLFGNGKCNLFDKYGNIINNIKYDVNLNIFNCGYLYVYEYDENYNIKYNLFDVDNNKLVSESFFKYELYCNNRYIIGYKNFNDDITRLTFDNETLWNYPLSSLGKLPYKNENDEVDKILGIAHGNLWFYTKAGRLIALDIETGEVTKKYSYLPEDKKLGYELTPGFGRIFFNEADENLYALGADYFHIINTKIKSIEEQYKHSISDPKGMGKYAIYSPLLQGDYFTFIAADQNSARLRFLGLFDIHKKQLVWEHELFSTKDDNELIAPEPLYMSGNKLYVKDFNSNLHIFERQD